MTELLGYVFGSLTDPYDKMFSMMFFMMMLEMFVSLFAVFMSRGKR